MRTYNSLYPSICVYPLIFLIDLRHPRNLYRAIPFHISSPFDVVVAISNEHIGSLICMLRGLVTMSSSSQLLPQTPTESKVYTCPSYTVDNNLRANGKLDLRQIQLN